MKTQNSANQTPAGPGPKGDKGIRLEERRQKKIIRKNALYNDQAIAAAKRSRGGE